MAMYCPNCLKFVNEADPVSCPYCGQNLKKKKEKPIYTRFLFVVIAICISVIGAVAHFKNTVVPEKEFVSTASKSETNSAFSPDPKLDEILQTLSPLVGYENISMTQSDNQVIVSCWYDGLAQSVASINNRDSDKLDAWERYVLNQQEQCNNFIAILRDEGYSHSVVWNILDDINKDSVLLSIVDGEVMYNSVD
mgnify:CR=1 FL=1